MSVENILGQSVFLTHTFTLPTTKRTAGPATRICQVNAIGKFQAIVFSQISTVLSCNPFLKASAATKLINGHIIKTVEICMAKIINLRLLSGFTKRKAIFRAKGAPANVCKAITTAISHANSKNEIAKTLKLNLFATII